MAADVSVTISGYICVSTGGPCRMTRAGRPSSPDGVVRGGSPMRRHKGKPIFVRLPDELVTELTSMPRNWPTSAQA